MSDFVKAQLVRHVGSRVEPVSHVVVDVRAEDVVYRLARMPGVAVQGYLITEEGEVVRSLHRTLPPACWAKTLIF